MPSPPLREREQGTIERFRLTGARIHRVRFGRMQLPALVEPPIDLAGKPFEIGQPHALRHARAAQENYPAALLLRDELGRQVGCVVGDPHSAVLAICPNC
jgi:hypothetical protein